MIAKDKLQECAIIIQARMSSDRFPGKMMSSIAGIPLVEYVYQRCKSSAIKNVLVATSDNKSDDKLYDYCLDKGILIIRASLDNVLDRFIKAAEFAGAQYIIRVCGDTPFVDIALFNKLLELLIAQGLDYASFNRTTCASGFFSEAVTLQTLKKVATLTKDKQALEHVTKFIIESSGLFRVKLIDIDLNPEFISKVRLTIDYPEDALMANAILEKVKDRFLFDSKEITDIVYKMHL